MNWRRYSLMLLGACAAGFGVTFVVYLMRYDQAVRDLYSPRG